MGFDSIDILKLYSGIAPGFEDDHTQLKVSDKTAVFRANKSGNLLRSHDKWNLWLKRCERSSNISELIKVRYSLQLGMGELVKKKLSTDDISETWVRWLMSIERTAKRIIKKKNPLPAKGAEGFLEQSRIKKRRDSEFELFLRKSSY